MNSRVINRNFIFGAFQLDATARLLKGAAGEVVPLTPKAFELLLILVESNGRLLTKADLMKRIWPDSFVEEANLTQTVSVLRKALGEQPHEHHYILTVPGQGYRFVASVRDTLESEDERAEEVSVDSTDDVRKRDERNMAAVPKSALASGVGRNTMIAAGLGLGLGLVLLLSAAYRLSRPSPPPKTITEVKSIAVLPLQNVGGKAEEEYLGQGLAEVLITKLSHIKTIVVRPTSAVTKYGDASSDPKTIGSTLDVEAVVIGRVQKVDENIRVTVQLVRVSDGATLWAATFDDKFTNIFAVEDSIATQVTASLAITLTSGEREHLAKRDTSNTDAFQLYLQGRYLWSKRTAEALKKSIDYFNQALEKDPNYALAYAGLADSYVVLPGFSGGSPQDCYPKAKAAAQKALELDDTLAEAHASLASALFLLDWNFSESNREFQRAIEMNPNYAVAHHWYGGNLLVLGRFNEAIPEMERARELDPLSLMINTEVGNTYLYARQYDQAIKQLRKTLEMDQNFYYAHYCLGIAQVLKGSFQEALVEYQKAKELSDDTFVIALIAHALAVSGKRDPALKTLAELKQISKQRYVSAYGFATVYAGLREKDQAFQWLEKSYEEREGYVTLLGIDPFLDNLRSDPRFADLSRRVGLP